eukprot:3262058-Prymnesium_polylepis.1
MRSVLGVALTNSSKSITCECTDQDKRTSNTRVARGRVTRKPRHPSRRAGYVCAMCGRSTIDPSESLTTNPTDCPMDQRSYELTS